MPANPMNPQPPIVQPGIQPPDEAIRHPGHQHPEREADPAPLPDEADQDELDLPPLP